MPATKNRPATTDAPIGSVQQAIKQSRPFRSRRQEAMVGLMLTAEAVRWPIQDLLARHDELTLQQYNVLRILRGAGPGGLCRNEIGDRLVRAVPDVTRLLDRMAEMKLIGRQRTDEDRRFVRTHLTPRGLELVNSLDEPVRDFHRRRLGHVDRTRLKALMDVLAEVRQAAG